MSAAIQPPTESDYRDRFLALLKHAGTDGTCRKCGKEVRWLSNKGRGAALHENDPTAWSPDGSDHVRGCDPEGAAVGLGVVMRDIQSTAPTAMLFWEQRLRSAIASCGDRGRCFGCNAQVFWIVHANKKKAPYTPEGLNHFADCPQRARFKVKP